MIVLFDILILFRFKAIRSSWLALNEIMIVLIAKGTQGRLTDTKRLRNSSGGKMQIEEICVLIKEIRYIFIIYLLVSCIPTWKVLE